ncbi:MAG TPA: DUF2334 domain-containing protein [Phenylobacterium sp.]|nr:DUF2334 domain-containing protein [Phenylobacterium sp.]
MSLPSASARPVRYFVRDDDIGELTDELKAFVELFLARRIPVSYQIIPERLSEACARYMADTADAHPDLVEIGQHGLRHGMTVKGKRLNREFGPERSLAQQSADIAEGLDLLRARLGADRPITVFTPPQHKFDRNTLTAAAAAGHRVFSAACYPTPHHRLAYALGRGLGLSSIRQHGISHHGRRRPEADLREVSISIAVDNGRTIKCGAGALDAALATAARHSDLVGLMFHHAVYAGAPGKQALEAIVERLAAHRPENFRKLGDLAPA